MPRAKTAAPLAVEPVITNAVPGTVLHLGDGRKLRFGETAQVAADVAKFLRERGQAK